MGRLTKRLAAMVLIAAAAGGWFAITVAPIAVRAGGEFSDLQADATFGVEMAFSASWAGSDPDYVELLLGFGTEERLVVPVELAGGGVDYRRDMTNDYVPPNTTVAYQWRAVSGAEVTVSAERTILYDDDRPGLDWERARIGSATVYWYGSSEAIAREFGDLAGGAADAAGELLGEPLANPIEIFVYDEREEFLGAVGPGAREWIGAATFPHLRTVFMWLGAGSEAFLRTTIAHEVTHVVFHDASTNPFHEPATWLNEGVATWSEVGNAESEDDLVRIEARSDGLMAFQALTDQFPIDVRGASLGYAQGATMVDRIISTYGSDAMAGIMDAYRSGATDEQAIETGTGDDWDDIRAAYFDAYGVTEPAPVEAQPLGRSDVALPPQPGAAEEPSGPQPGQPGGSQDLVWWLIIGLVVVGVVFLGVAVYRARRAGPPGGGPLP
jgi:Peptidase MA superfamily